MVPVIHAATNPSQQVTSSHILTTSTLPRSSRTPSPSSSSVTPNSDNPGIKKEILSPKSDEDDDYNGVKSEHESDMEDQGDESHNIGTNGLLRCPTCGRVCSDPAHLSNHIKLVHSNITTKIERKKTLKCHICHKLFGRSSHLAEHIKSVHEGNKRVYQKAVCGECGRVFARKCSLNQHITAAHGGNRMNL